MAHPVQIVWCEKIKEDFPEYFRNKRVLDVGALDYNGNNRYWCEDCEYIGLAVVPGPNVDVVSIAHEYMPSESFDVVLSTNALEHDLHWEKTLAAMFTFLKPGGLLFFSVAFDWSEHGTKRHLPNDSGTSQMGGEWENYYRNLCQMDLYKVLDWHQIDKYEMSTRQKDLRFWAIKKADCL